ncbi:MAG: succinylglutamate desuccinylase/aspartoacylase family protein [Dehalococcoidia bacterium]|nr:succinylglutamate desuccinylase/aspartoacylase family protein [Dehalococcoidia bacterium]
MVLGGVHGNEPGGWLAAEATAQWEVDRGVLIVLPRLNHRAAAAFERTLEGTGDLNRLYPGDPQGPPMAQMAWEVTALAKQWRPHWLWDMHESWGFFNERGENSGTAFIGQTITATNAEAAAAVEEVVATVNAEVEAREVFTTRNRPGGRFGSDPFAPPSDEALRGRRGSSSLSLGNHITGLKPVLVEMGQMDQPEWRRSELHQLLARRMMQRLGMLPLT